MQPVDFPESDSASVSDAPLSDASERPLRVLLVGQLQAQLLRPLLKMIHATGRPIEFDSYGDWKLLKEGGDPPVDEAFPSLLKPAKPARNFGGRVGSSKLGYAIRRLVRRVESAIGCMIFQRQFDRRLRQYDVVSVQSLLDRRLLKMLLRSKSGVPLVVTLWGSEVLRCSKMVTCRLHQQVLQKSTKITCTGIEFREIVLAKYGRNLRPKIRETFFSPNAEMMGTIVKTERSQAKLSVENELGLDAKKLLVCLGHNGFEENQHLDALGQLARLSSKVSRSLQIVCPMTYGGLDDYQSIVQETMDASGFTGTVLREFLDELTLANLVKATDVYIYVAISDSFSASVSQAIAGECITIVGSWLPYATRRRAGMKYLEIDELSELPGLVESICERLEEYRNDVEGNAERSLEFFDSHRLGESWFAVFCDAAKSSDV